MMVDVAIALGSNLGDSLAILENAVADLSRENGIELLAKSAWYKTKAIGPPQPDYLNGCITCRVALEPEVLLNILQAIENCYGRQRTEHWGARTLDLDLILYGQQVIDLPHLQVPHPLMKERVFVLMPLTEIAADWVEPVSLKTIRYWGDRLSTDDIQRL
ncbi:MAG: 2-amino-4-hydroxy-6-hydroxymethyldihydropteridine diphosphokinase [Limnothrix sp.]